MNTLILIGPVGDKHAYLNLSRREAERRYRASEHVDADTVLAIQEIVFDEEFWVYSAEKKS